MSVSAMAWAWQQDVSPTDKLVLLALADHADSQGVCWPGLMGIAQKCHLDKRSVQRHVQQLSTSGFILRQSRYRDDGSQASNCYVLPILSPPHDAGVTLPMTLASPLEPSLEPSYKQIHCDDTKNGSSPDSISLSNSAPRRKKTTDPNIKLLVDFYFGRFKAKFKAPPPITGKDAKTCQRLLASRSLDEAKWLITEFLDVPPQFYADKNLYGLEYVLRAAPTLLARRAKEEDHQWRD